MLIKGDLEQAHRIYGEQLEYVRGRMVKKMVRRVLADASLIAVHQAQSMYADVMHIDRKIYPVLVTEPLNLMLQSKIENEHRT
jgi:hypothetical protein